MLKNFFYLILIILLIPSCNTMGSIKRGLTGEKANSADEFLVKKKDPLILPPDFENLPTPSDMTKKDEDSIFEKKIEEQITESSTEASSVEESLLRKIQKK